MAENSGWQGERPRRMIVDRWCGAALVAMAILLLSAIEIVSATASETPDTALNVETANVWVVAEQKYITPREMVRQLRAIPYVLIGELHDNSHHHVAEAWLVERIADARINAPPAPRTAIVFEMIGEDEKPALAERRAAGWRHLDTLGAALKWRKRGWPDWELYRPIAAAALANGLDLRAGNVARKDMHAVARQGLQNLAAEKRTRLLLDKPLSDAATADLVEELFEGHCELMPRAALGNMASAQRLRDATLAATMATATGAILIAGNGHVRKDRGVPLYLKRLAPGRKIGAVHLAEREAGAALPTVPGENYERFADYVWFLPTVEREDPCIALRKRFEKHAPKRAPAE